MGSRGIGISTYAIIFLSFTILFFPIQYGYGIFKTAPELSEQELNELYKQEQLASAEQKRDEIFVLLRLQDPYSNTPSDSVSSFEENDEKKSLKPIDRKNENFQAIKDEQLSIAEKKCKEILGGKTISNPINYEPPQKKTVHALIIDNQTGFLNRNSEEFQNYKLLQISLVEDYRDNNWKENLWALNPYQNNELKVTSNNDEKEILEDKTDSHHTDELENLKSKQVFLAEKIRNEMLDVKITGLPNPYLDEKIDEGFEVDLNEDLSEAGGKTNQNIAISWSDPTYVTDKPEFNIIDRKYKEFEMVKAMEFEIAKNKLNEMLHLSNVKNDDVKIIFFVQDNKKPKNYDRYDKGFEFFINLQKVEAEKQLMEILGQKNIHNPDYLEFEKIKEKYYSNLD